MEELNLFQIFLSRLNKIDVRYPLHDHRGGCSYYLWRASFNTRYRLQLLQKIGEYGLEQE